MSGVAGALLRRKNPAAVAGRPVGSLLGGGAYAVCNVSVSHAVRDKNTPACLIRPHG